MRLSAWKYVFFLTVIFACGYANAGFIAKRETSRLGSFVNSIESSLEWVPLVGGGLAGVVKWFVSIFQFFEDATNGAIARFLGGAVPCTVDFDGTRCQGLETNGGLGKALMGILDGLHLPEMVNTVVELFINSIIDPTADVVFGGILIDNPTTKDPQQ